MGNEDPRVSFRYPEEKKEQLESDESVNVSGLMRSLADAYLLAGDTVEAGLQRRLKDKENELERKRLEKARVESEMDNLQREISQLEKKIDERRQQTPEEIIEFAEGVKSGRFTEEQLEVDNPAVKNWANKAGVPPGTFVEEVTERL